jgi:predicted DNA-binding antitoxin AbrB/MazE fold protein
MSSRVRESFRRGDVVDCWRATITVEATFEKGVLKPKQPLTMIEGTEVWLTITPQDDNYDPLGLVIGIGAGGRGG